MKISFLLTLLLLFLFACTDPLHETQDISSTPALLAQGNSAWNCESVGNGHTFLLQSSTRNQSGGASIPNNMTYYVYLSGTPPYQLEKNCMCHIQHYELEFDFLPPASQIMVANQNQFAIPFTGPTTLNNGRQAIRIQKQYIHQGIYVGFSGGIDPEPSLRSSGGFCIIDNISAPVETADPILEEVYIEPVVDLETELEYQAYYLPEFMLIP